MKFAEFSTRAQRVFDEIPASFKEGVDGLEVTRRTVPHPTLPEVFTLGECLSEFYPSDFGGPGEVRSRVVLYYGSFLELSRTSEEWSWEEEIWETITHEIKHHLEHLASEDALEEMDYAEDQNFARREGESFDPFFYHSGEAAGEGTFVVDGDVFIERRLDRRAIDSRAPVELTWRGRSLSLPLPAELGDVHFLRVPNVDLNGSGDMYLVLVRRRGVLDWLREVSGGARLRVTGSDAVVAEET